MWEMGSLSSFLIDTICKTIKKRTEPFLRLGGGSTNLPHMGWQDIQIGIGDGWILTVWHSISQQQDFAMAHNKEHLV